MYQSCSTTVSGRMFIFGGDEALSPNYSRQILEVKDQGWKNYSPKIFRSVFTTWFPKIILFDWSRQTYAAKRTARKIFSEFINVLWRTNGHKVVGYKGGDRRPRSQESPSREGTGDLNIRGREKEYGLLSILYPLLTLGFNLLYDARIQFRGEKWHIQITFLICTFRWG